MIGNASPYIEACYARRILINDNYGEIYGGLGWRSKSLCGCVFRREECRPCKLLIDLGMQRSCIPLAGMELYKNTSKSEKTNPIFLTHPAPVKMAGVRR